MIVCTTWYFLHLNLVNLNIQQLLNAIQKLPYQSFQSKFFLLLLIIELLSVLLFFSKVYEAFDFDDDNDRGPASAKRKTPGSAGK